MIEKKRSEKHSRQWRDKQQRDAQKIGNGDVGGTKECQTKTSFNLYNLPSGEG